MSAVAANAGAAAAATAVAVDGTVHDFMDDRTANLVSMGELLLPVGAALAVAAFKAISTKVAAKIAANPLKSTPFFTKKYTKEWATTSKGQAAWAKLKSKLSDPPSKLAEWQKWQQDLQKSGLYRELLATYRPTETFDDLMRWLSKTEWDLLPKARKKAMPEWQHIQESRDLLAKSLVQPPAPAVKPAAVYVKPYRPSSPGKDYVNLSTGDGDVLPSHNFDGSSFNLDGGHVYNASYKLT